MADTHYATRHIEVETKVPSIEDGDDKPSITVAVHPRQIEIQTMFGSTSFPVEDWEAIKAEVDHCLKMVKQEPGND